MNQSQQASVRTRQSKLIAALKKTSVVDEEVQALPTTTTWSHAGLYMGDMGVQLSGVRLL